MTVITQLLQRKDVERDRQRLRRRPRGRADLRLDAREGRACEKPVQRLWLSSMTTGAIKQAFAALRPAEEFAKLEQAARSRSEADWIVGMNATRAATIRLRSSFDGAVSLGRVQTPTLAIIARREEEIRAFKPEPYWLVDAHLRADAAASSGARYAGRFHAGSQPRLKTADGGRGGRRGRPRPARARSPSSRRPSAPRRRRCCTTSRACSARPTRATASPPGARSPPPSGSTRSTRRSPTRAPTRASCRRTWAGRSSRSPSCVGTATATTRRPPPTSPGSTCSRPAA